MDVKCYDPHEVNVCYPTKSDCRATRALRSIRGLKVCSYGERDVNGIKVLGVGFRGIVVKGLLNGIPVAVKLPRSDWPGSFENEARIQKLAYPVAPKVLSYTKDYIIMEYIDCPDIKDVIVMYLSDKDALKKLIMDVLKAGRELDKRRIDHGELVRPWKHVKICSKGPRIIDYGKASLVRKPRNVTSLISGLLLKPNELALRIADTLNVNKSLLIEKLRAYKREPSEEAFEELLRVID